jgi:hypothetical protein
VWWSTRGPVTPLDDETTPPRVRSHRITKPGTRSPAIGRAQPAQPRPRARNRTPHARITRAATGGHHAARNRWSAGVVWTQASFRRASGTNAPGGWVRAGDRPGAGYRAMGAQERRRLPREDAAPACSCSRPRRTASYPHTQYLGTRARRHDPDRSPFRTPTASSSADPRVVADHDAGDTSIPDSDVFVKGKPRASENPVKTPRLPAPSGRSVPPARPE